jgi:NAD(P)-dependent dehydrogenase (short-subunit alcohol dehydrogenase family)
MSKPTCIITGVGPGTGSALVRKFSERYTVAMLARKLERLEALAEEIPDAHPYPCDVADEEALQSTLGAIDRELGPPAVAIHNAARGTLGDVLSVDPKDLQTNFSINTMALLHIIQHCAPAMAKAGSGAILATGNTAAYRGKAAFPAFAPTKAAQRILLEAAARSLGPEGIHVAYVAIDAVIDVPWTRAAWPERPDEYFAQPDDIAAECFHVAHQPRSAWTFDVLIRPFGEQW